MLALQCMYDNLLKMHGFCWALHAKWYPSVRIDKENLSYTWTWEQVKLRSMSKQNRRSTSMSCWHCNACMIICWKGIAFDVHCMQSGNHQWGSTKKIPVKHDLGSRLYIREVKVKTKLEVHINIMLVVQCMHDNLLKRHSFCWARQAKWYPSVRIDEENPS